MAESRVGHFQIGMASTEHLSDVSELHAESGLHYYMSAVHRKMGNIAMADQHRSAFADAAKKVGKTRRAYTGQRTGEFFTSYDNRGSFGKERLS